MPSLKLFYLLLISVVVEGFLYRLPNDVEPISYDLKIAPNPENSTFAGEVNIRVHVKFTTDQIVLHSRDLEIGNVRLKKLEHPANDTASNITAHTLDKQNQILIIKCDGKFEFNADYIVSITFQGPFLDRFIRDSYSTGFYRYADRYRKSWGASTQFETSGARTVFPCFDEPRYRASFSISLARPENYSAVSNMPSEAVLPPDSLSNGFVWEKFQPTPPMPTYLIAFVVSNFKSLKNEDGRLRVMARPHLIHQASYALKQAEKLLKYYEGYTGIPYSLPKLDLIAFPMFISGAMENWGLIMYGEEGLLLRETSSIDKKLTITMLTSHELSHMWFGDLVTIAWYDHLWLKEGFATYLKYTSTAAIEPTWDMESIFVINIVHTTLEEDTKIEKPITRPIRNFSDISATFDSISYGKAACVIKMFELIVSPGTFQNALHNYLNNGQQNQIGVTTPRNLFDAFDQQVELDSVSHLPPHVSASDIMKTWVDNVGYPVINIVRSHGRKEVVITQTPFEPVSYLKRVKNDQKWIIPLTYTTKSLLQFSNLQPTHWSFADEPTILSGVDEQDWILFNLKQSGYYRVNYDKQNWQLLIHQLTTNHSVIHPLNRAQLIDDAIVLFLDGKFEFSILFSLLEYLEYETNVIPLYSAFRSFSKLMDRVKGTHRVSIAFERYFKELFTKSFQHIGCNVLSNDDPITTLIKPHLNIFRRRLGLACV